MVCACGVSLGAGVATAIVLAVQLLVGSKVTASKDGRDVNIPRVEASSWGQPPVEASVTTVAAYDFEQWKTWIKGTLTQTAILLFIHIKFEVVPVLVIAPSGALMDLASHALVKLYLLGHPSVGDLARPFPAPKGFMDQFKEMQEDAKKKAGVVEPKSKEAKKLK